MRLRRVLALYSPQGNAPGWAIWVDAWAESLRSQDMRTASRALDVRWKDVLAGASGPVSPRDASAARTRDGAAWRLSALLDGLAMQVTVHRNLTKRQLADWVRGSRRASSGSTPSELV